MKFLNRWGVAEECRLEFRKGRISRNEGTEEAVFLYVFSVSVTPREQRIRFPE